MRDKIASPDWDLISEAYRSLVGEDIPAEYTKQENWGKELKLSGAMGTSGAEADTGGEADTGRDATGDDADDGITVGKLVEFEDDGVAYSG